MSKRWDSSCWTPKRQRLCRAVHDASRKESRYAPMDRSLPVGQTLFRGFDRAHLKPLGPDRLHHSVPMEAIRVRDAGTDSNRFTGVVPGLAGQARIELGRGGLYCSQQVQALAAETYEYSKLSLPTGALTLRERYDIFLPRCFVTLQVVGEIDVVNLDSRSDQTFAFLERLQRHDEVHAALRDMDRAKQDYPDLFAALYHPEDYSAARGLGLGLIQNPEIGGLQVLSARDYQTPVAGQTVFQTGDNVVLFNHDGAPASDMVKVSALHVVDRDGPGSLSVAHFEPGSGGLFELAGKDSLSS